MKLTCLIVLLGVIHSFAGKSQAQNTNISMNVKNASVETVLQSIEEQTDFYFLYSRSMVDVSRKVDVQVTNIKIEELLNDLFEDTGISYVIEGRQIILSGGSAANLQSAQQQISVSGKVTDSSGAPLPGVTIVLKGSTTGTISDINGTYSMSNVSPNATLVFSFIGMKTQEVEVNGRQVINVALEEETIGLEEVVAIGYGSVAKKDLTGAVASVGHDDLVSVGSTSPLKALQANSAGVNISQRTGSVGSEFDIQIRGANSLTGAAPLYVVDGVMTDNINFLNTNDIQRIDILKDASSTAIYGSRGSNGVVIVTTRSGEGIKVQKPSITYSGYVGLRTISNMPDFLNSYDESIKWNIDRQVTRDLVQGKPIVPSVTYSFPTVIRDGVNYWEEALTERRGTDWVDELLKSSIQQNHFVSASGGNNNISYVVGFGYQGDDGNAKGQWYKKYNFKASVDARPDDRFSVGANINLAFSDRELVSRQGYTRQIFRMPAFAPAKDKDGNTIQSPMIGISSNVNPYAYLETDSKYNVEQYYVISNFYLSFSPAKWINLKTTFSPNAKFGRDGEYFDRFATRSISVARMWNTNKLSFIWDNQLSLNKEVGEHRFSYDFIQSSQFDRYESAFAYGRDVPFQSLWYNVQSAPQRDATTGFSKSTLLSFTNRFNYSFRDKYLFTATVRWDGSSKLAEGNKWAYFPSAAIAWRMNEESFLSGVSQINNLKLRLSFGYTGNNNIDPYTTQSALNRQTYYDWDETTANGFIPNALANSELTWERTREWNLGADFGLFDSRISGEINVYDRLSLDLLMERKLAMPTGWATMMDNVGSVSNKGIELQVRTINVKRKDFTWETNFIFSKNTNKIVELYGAKEDDVPNRWFIGQPVNVVYGMVFDGVWQRDELAPEDRQALEGTAKVKDLNGDGNIDIDQDMKVLGSPDPKWIGTFSTNLTYKNWNLSATVYTKQGILQFSPFHEEFTDFNSKVILDVPYYLRENPITEARYSNTYPQPAYQGQYWGEDAEDYGFPGFNKDASFVRVQNITLGYNFSRKLLSRLGLAEMRLYFNALNPFVFTKYDGFDPEWAGADMSGVDATNTSYTIYQIGTNIKF
ncbi:TonB-dependent receptor [Gaoshiqia sediminis]|uniref:TonB-dependent receptor n=1 Tax=Gaoshiqia sediminis TaxID=2986998 RepID=A0AA41Y8T9_9BACT|nr:TonB-dependent receptor [Gaoshiqia sediminis]MCW0481315.1 TonB-dependent receptor [Gaoshiqia sediminis]